MPRSVPHSVASPRKARRRLFADARIGLATAAAYVVAHLSLILLLPAHAKTISYLFLIAAPLLASAASFACALRSRAALNWIGLGAGLLLWACGMASGFYMDVFAPNGSDTSGLSILLYVLYGVPLAFVLASPKGDVWSARLIDAGLALALGGLFFTATFTFATMTAAKGEGLFDLSLMLDAQNLFLLVFSLTRWRASDTPSQKDYFRVAAMFAAAYVLMATYINHVEGESDYGAPVDALIDLPFLFLLGLALRRLYGPLPSRMALAGARLAMIVRAVSPIILPLALFAVSCLLIFFKPWFAVTGFLAALIGYSLRTVLAQFRVSADNAKLERLTRIDPLTELANRRHFDDVLAREARRAVRADAPLSLLMIDIDHFKSLNDAYGHVEGDRYLRQVARALSACASRGGDLVARYGGEEFAIVLPDVAAEDALCVARNALSAVVGLALPSPAPRGVVTVSIGAATLAPDADHAALLAAADAALYRAKASGRNQVVLDGASALTPDQAMRSYLSK
ncbi:MAG: GGDEF domain-containing protein [Asticcacaulis sp.]|uniref:GGDEF domain-containing protein n=1 Tax=Asticcacaulis sp. TaxID=1872648 RepID=UPI003F7CD0E2